MSETDPLGSQSGATEAEDTGDETEAEWEIESKAGGSRSKVALSWELAGLLRAARGLALEIAESSGPDEKCGYERMASQLEELAATAGEDNSLSAVRAIKHWAIIYCKLTAPMGSKLFSGSAVRLRLDRPPESPQEDPAPQPPAPQPAWAQGRSGRRGKRRLSERREPGAGRPAERREP